VVARLDKVPQRTYVWNYTPVRPTGAVSTERCYTPPVGCRPSDRPGSSSRDWAKRDV
jgi:hypothetical protein